MKFKGFCVLCCKW